ncbi:oligoribonuclease [Alkalihalophilus pseudofirmus]|uniref:DHH family phosphoesterase n=1 Tax=Alkalihalophilus pseudofirmus TaxID=79885 RepID=UPI000951A9AA|nr:oligoribonuclease [Alkalihalophilus pseudofirmus]
MYRLYTHNDLDGIGCGIVAKLAFGDQVKVFYNSVQSLDRQIERFFEEEKEIEQLIISDLSINEENTKRVEEYVQKGGNAVLIDHHKTALHFNEYDWAKVEVEYEDGRLTSATSLLYEYLCEQQLLEPKPAIDQFVDLVRQWDTWEWDENETVDAKRLNDLFFMISMDEFEERMVTRLKENNAFSFDEFEGKLLAMEETKIERYIRRKRREMVQTFVGKHCTGIVYAESYHSELGNELGKESPHLDYITILNAGGRKISFRTIHDDIDVSEVAKKFDGGGHAKASGCQLTNEAFQLFVTKPFALAPLRIDASRNYLNHKESQNGSLYAGPDDTQYFIYPTKENQWVVDSRDKVVDSFNSFEKAERFIKRKYAAWLLPDDQFVEYLAKRVIKHKQKESQKH